MKNLNELANEIWEQKCPSKKRELLHKLIDYSDAKRLTKVKYHLEVDRVSDYELDYLAANYKLSGDGHKVIK